MHRRRMERVVRIRRRRSRKVFQPLTNPDTYPPAAVTLSMAAGFRVPGSGITTAPCPTGIDAQRFQHVPGRVPATMHAQRPATLASYAIRCRVNKLVADWYDK